MGKNIIGHKIRLYRAMQNPPMPQRQLLARVHLNGWLLSQSTLSKIENETRSVSDSELMILAKALDADILWFLDKSKKSV